MKRQIICSQLRMCLLTYSSLRFSQTSYSRTMLGCSRSFITAISRSKPYGIGLWPEADWLGEPFVLSIKLARLWARVLSATVRVMILTAPY